MDIKRRKTLEACNVATRREEIDFETVRRQIRYNGDKNLPVVSRILELPLPLLYDILIRISAHSIFSCRCVCKTFFNILSDPQFSQDHFKKAVTTTDNEALVIQNDDYIEDILFIYNHMSEFEKTNIGDYSNSHCQTLSMPTGAMLFPSIAYLVGTCNGLLCIRYTSFVEFPIYYYVCNPILGEFLALPPHDEARYHNPAFGFCPKTKHYKVILFLRYSPCKIHTLGTDSWRDISDNKPDTYYAGSYNQSFRGFLHWIVDKYTVSKMICSFNLETEQASFLPTPSHFTVETLRELSFFWIGSLGGLLCLSYHHGTTFEVCVMKNYGVKESWSKAFSIDLGLNPEFREWDFSHGYAFINGNLYFKHEKASLVCYSLQKGSITKLLADVAFTQIRHFRPSLISLKDIAVNSGRNVEVVEHKMRRNNWSDKGFKFIY